MENPNVDEKVLSYGDVVLRRSDLDILRGPYFINDRIIEFYFTYLSSTLPAEEILLVSPSIAQWIKECNGSIEDFVKPLNFPQKKLILFPINDNVDVTRAEGGSHWTLLAYVKSANVFVHHDSSSGKLNMLQARRLYLPVLNYTSYTADFIDCPSTPKQVNGHDCGLYVIAFARAICSWFKNTGGWEKKSLWSDNLDDVKTLWFGDLDHITPSAVSEMRSEILDFINSLMVKK